MGTLIQADFKTGRFETDRYVRLNRFQHIGASAVLSNTAQNLVNVMQTVGIIWLNDPDTVDLAKAQRDAVKNCSVMDKVLSLNELDSRYDRRRARGGK